MATTHKTLILSQTQAQAVYSAMCALYEVGGKLSVSMYERAQAIAVRDVGGFVRVEVDGLQREVYESKAVFASVYGLDGE